MNIFKKVYNAQKNRCSRKTAVCHLERKLEGLHFTRIKTGV